MKQFTLSVILASTVILSACDAYTVYELRITDTSGKPIQRAEVKDPSKDFDYQADTSGYLRISKVSGGLFPKRSIKMHIYKEGYQDTLVRLRAGGFFVIPLSKQ